MTNEIPRRRYKAALPEEPVVFEVPSTMMCVALVTIHLKRAQITAKPGFTARCHSNLTDAAKYASALGEVTLHGWISEVLDILKPDIVIPLDGYTFLQDRCHYLSSKWLEILQKNPTRYIPSEN